MTAAKPAAATRARTTTPKTSKPSPEKRIAALEEQVDALRVQVKNLAEFIARGVAQQLHAQLLASPDLQLQLAALAVQPAGQ